MFKRKYFCINVMIFGVRQRETKGKINIKIRLLVLLLHFNFIIVFCMACPCTNIFMFTMFNILYQCLRFVLNVHKAQNSKSWASSQPQFHVEVYFWWKKEGLVCSTFGWKIQRFHINLVRITGLLEYDEILSPKLAPTFHSNQ